MRNPDIACGCLRSDRPVSGDERAVSCACAGRRSANVGFTGREQSGQAQPSSDQRHLARRYRVLPMAYRASGEMPARCRGRDGDLAERGGVGTRRARHRWSSFPWADEWRDDCANTREAGIGDTCAVGAFPDGMSEAGCLDMAGNVWEWTRSLWGKDWQKPDFKYPYQPDDPNREDLDAGDDVWRVLRGGSFDRRSRPRALCLSPQASTRLPRRRHRVSGGVAFSPCWFALISVALRSVTLILRLCSPPRAAGRGRGRGDFDQRTSASERAREWDASRTRARAVPGLTNALDGQAPHPNRGRVYGHQCALLEVCLDMRPCANQERCKGVRIQSLDANPDGRRSNRSGNGKNRVKVRIECDAHTVVGVRVFEDCGIGRPAQANVADVKDLPPLVIENRRRRPGAALIEQKALQADSNGTMRSSRFEAANSSAWRTSSASSSGYSRKRSCRSG